MRNLFVITAISLSALAVAACGGDDGEGGTTSTPTGPTVEEASAKTLDIRCETGVECKFYADDAECRASTADLNAQYMESIKAGRVVYHADKMQACLDSLEIALGCSVIDVFGASSVASEDACFEAFEPKVADGGACYASIECVSRNCETPECDMACCEGKCATITKVKIGDSCAMEETCEDGAYCKPDAMGMPGACAAQASDGKPCDAFDGCVVPSFCALDFATMMGTCVTPAAHGATCDTNASFPCDRIDDYCDATTKKCVASKLAGEACSDDVPCAFSAVCSSGKCEQKPSKGGACDPMEFFPCLGDLECKADSKTCELPENIACP